MRRLALLAVLLLPVAAVAQDAGGYAAAQLVIANQLLDQQKAQIIQLGAQLILAQQETVRLKAELEKAKGAAVDKKE